MNFKHLILLLCSVLILHSCTNKNTNENKIKAEPNPAKIVAQHIHLDPIDKRKKSIDYFFEKRKKLNLFNGNILFAEKGKIITQKSFGMAHFRKKDTLTSDHTFQLASVSKTITAIATLQLIDKGELKLTDTVKQFLPRFPYNGIDIHQLLSHRSGMSQYTHFCDRPDSIWPDKSKTITIHDVLDIMERIVPMRNYPPNKRYYYCNTNYIILALIIEKVTNQPFSTYVQKHIFDPVGMQNSVIYDRTNLGSLHLPVQGYENRIPWEDVYLNGCVGDKGVYCSTEDLYKFDRALALNIILSDSLKQLAFSPKSRNFKGNQNYGYGFRLKEDEVYGKLVYHTGWWKGFRSYFIKVPEKDQTIIVLNNVKRGRFFRISELVSLLN
ncbi:MAG: serine hydrolase domain-containing protein [Bacteroidota bacterium]|nr:serine hydrolase domain-containing protein [Bacteroidota bacterium]